MIAFVLSGALCAVPSGLAILAWLKHWQWQKTGAYSQNSFPMYAAARDLTILSIACMAIVGVGWAIRSVVSRRKQRQARRTTG